MRGGSSALLGVVTRAEVRSRLSRLAMITLVVAIAGGAVLVAGAGARRPASSFERRADRLNVPDGSIAGSARAADDAQKLAVVERQPGVERAEVVWSASTGLAV